MSCDSLFGILLHTGIYGDEHFQTVSIKVIRFTVIIQILVAPSEKGILFPIQRILPALNI